MLTYANALLHAKIAAICPIDGVAIGDPANPATWRIDFAKTATVTQIAAAQAQLALITPALLAQADATIQAAAAAQPNPLAAATTSALASLPTSVVAAPVG